MYRRYAADSGTESDKESRNDQPEDTAPQVTLALAVVPHINPVCCVQAPKCEGDPVMRAELQLLEKLIMGIREPPSSGEWCLMIVP